MEWLFGRRMTPEEQLKKNQRALNKAMRELDRERAKMEQQEKKISLLEISKKGGTEALMKEVELLKKKESSCQKAKGRLEESNTDQKLKLETTQHNLIVLREERAELRKVAGA